MSLPTFSEERLLWKQGFDVVIGVDEVGRGAFAGPVVVAACAFDKLALNKSWETLGINDSKQIKPLIRQRLARVIKEGGRGYAVASVSVSVINKIGITKATTIAMRQAVNRIVTKVSQGRTLARVRPSLNTFVLVDAFHIRYLRGIGAQKQKGIIKGDTTSISIAAASIVAKVERDKFMLKLSKNYPLYGWGRNKGYGTKEHQEAIRKQGLTRHHRKQFVETALKI